MKRFYRGEIWWADLGQPDGRVQGYPRPVLVVSSNALHARTRGELAWIVPITTRKRGWDGHIHLAPGADTGLESDSYAMTEQLRVFNARDWLVRRVGAAPAAAMGDVSAAIRMLADLV
ncbi:type II toxin-antitoxin system PemK/MazF family toxin [Nonomuraea sp. 3N208]|uniref:type II toxin-antitoxin system PemK/MazF family toxin n=1 Tax=Nonomuraea sp. 3N208 TaxID=3457421 RepID=UPI003FCF24FA